jgi:hypothetical protein
MRALEGKGWVVHPQVGVSFFRVDLGVVHPDFPGRYLAGVECDGATYHRSATARDRDRLREMVLTDLGWRIRRIWSTEWWMDASSALQKVHARLEADLAADRASRVAQEAPVEPAATTTKEGAAERPEAAADMEGPVEAQPAQAQQAALPTPANDQEPPRLYARGPTSAETDDMPATYTKDDPSVIVAHDRDRFYEVSACAAARRLPPKASLHLRKFYCGDRPVAIMASDRNSETVEFIEPKPVHRSSLSVVRITALPTSSV